MYFHKKNNKYDTEENYLHHFTFWDKNGKKTLNFNSNQPNMHKQVSIADFVSYLLPN